MRLFKIGYTWSSQSGAGAPVLLSANYARHILPRKISRYHLYTWAIDYSLMGGVRFRMRSPNNPWVTRKPRSARLYGPNQCIWEDTSRLRRPHGISTYVLFTGGESIGLDRLLSSAGYVQFADSGDHLSALFKEIAEVGQMMGAQGLCRANALLWQIFDLLLNSKPSGDIRKVRPKILPRSFRSPLCHKIDAYFENHVSEKITRHMLAKEFHLSVSSLSHFYRAETGMSPMQRLIQARINRAKHLILRGTCLKQIAEETGFNDQFHLSKTFKHVEGVSPSVFLIDALHHNKCLRTRKKRSFRV